MGSFDPREVQTQYLHEINFRETLIELVRHASMTANSSYEFSNENETRRMDATRALTGLFRFLGVADRSDVAGMTDRTYWIYANRIILKYKLGRTITKREVGVQK